MTLKPTGRHMEASARVKAVADNAGSIVVNPETHPKMYLKSGRELLRMAASYQEDKMLEEAYTLYLRFLTIFLDKIRTHPNYKEISPSERKVMSNFCTKIFPEAEKLKQELLQKYEKEHEEYLIQMEKLKQQANEQRRKELEEQAKSRNKSIKSNQGVTGGEHFPGYNYSDLANSHKFIPDPSSLAVAQPGQRIPGQYIGDDKFAELSRDLDFDCGGGSRYKPSAPPAVASTSGEGAAAASTLPSSGHPAVDRSTKPNRFLNPNETGTRNLIIPQNIASTFLNYAVANTSKNVETCGLLTGKISGGALIITDLIIPKQSGTSDTCNMSDEAEIFDIQDKFNLITVGWIHTHPSQTAFLSSIDMHTHYSYQVMMPESVAIVCAPKHNQTGIFTLTADGMDELGSCNLQGFHPHKPTGLFTEASHYSLDGNLKVSVHDLR